MGDQNIVGGVFKSQNSASGIWGNGIFSSQQRSPYAFRLVQLPDGTLLDTVSGKSPSYSFAGSRFDDVNGVHTEFLSTQPVVTEKGIRCVGAYSNLLRWSEEFTNVLSWKNTTYTIVPNQQDPFAGNNATKLNKEAVATILTQNLAVNIGYSYALSIWLRGEAGVEHVRIDFRNSASDGPSGLVRNLSSVWRLYSQVFTSDTTGDRGFQIRKDTIAESIYIYGAMVSQKKYPHPYIKTEASPVLSTSDNGTASGGSFTNGVALENVPVWFPKLAYALGNKGSFAFSFTPGYNKADVSGALNFFSFDGLSNSIGYDASNGLLTATDGTHTATCVLNAVANTTYNCKVEWEKGSRLQVFVGSTAGTAVNAFNGFNIGTDTVFGLNNPELHYIDNFVVTNKPTWRAPV